MIHVQLDFEISKTTFGLLRLINNYIILYHVENKENVQQEGDFKIKKHPKN